MTVVDPALQVDEDILHDTKIKFIKGTLENINDGHDFQIITMWDAIEHVEDPLALVLQAKELLSESGVLVLETGNYLGLSGFTNGI